MRLSSDLQIFSGDQRAMIGQVNAVRTRLIGRLSCFSFPQCSEMSEAFSFFSLLHSRSNVDSKVVVV